MTFVSPSASVGEGFADAATDARRPRGSEDRVVVEADAAVHVRNPRGTRLLTNAPALLRLVVEEARVAVLVLEATPPAMSSDGAAWNSALPLKRRRVTLELKIDDTSAEIQNRAALTLRCLAPVIVTGLLGEVGERRRIGAEAGRRRIHEVILLIGDAEARRARPAVRPLRVRRHRRARRLPRRAESSATPK